MSLRAGGHFCQLPCDHQIDVIINTDKTWIYDQIMAAFVGYYYYYFVGTIFWVFKKKKLRISL